MARIKLGERSIRKLIKLGRGSIAVTLPIELVRALKWRGKQKVGPTTSLRVNGAAARAGLDN
ncbi:hypothetical protein IH781_04250 [Patescibacteria group bacterium]|nr:hypothetical protein [Patescibacteria group bacterium]